MSSPTDLGGEPDPANGPENSEEPQHTPAEHEATETAAVFFTPALPPPIPRRPSAVGRAKLRKSLQVADSTGGEEAKQAPDVAVAKNEKASLPQTREDMRKIYFLLPKPYKNCLTKPPLKKLNSDCRRQKENGGF